MMDNLEKDEYIKERSKINDKKLYIKHYINGNPTVLFEAGMGDSSETWSTIQDKISLLTSIL